MDIPKDAAAAGLDLKASHLLEQLCHGNSEEVEMIIRFAREKRVEDDDLVFMLISTLKANETLIRYLLEAIDDTIAAGEKLHSDGQKLSALEQQSIAQINRATNRSIGGLNLAADRLTSTVAKVEQLCGAMLGASRSLIHVEGALEHVAEVEKGKHAFDGVVRQIKFDAQRDLRGYHAEIVRGLADEVGRHVKVLHIYGIMSLIVLAVILITWSASH